MLIDALSRSRGALRAGPQPVPYAELAERAARLAGALQGVGVTAGERVAVLLANGPEYVAVFLAITSLGATVVPLNPVYQAAELESYVGQARCTFAICNDESVKKLLGVAERLGLRLTVIADTRGSGAHHELAALAQATTPARLEPRGGSELAAFLHTSGSTGRPKLVPRTHDELTAEGRAIVSSFSLTEDDRVFVSAPFFHAYGLTVGLLASLRSGATLFTLVGRQPLATRAREITELLAAERITAIFNVPMFYELLARSPHRGELGAVRVALSAGIGLKKAAFEAFDAAFGVPVRQLYGASEAGVIAANTDADPRAAPESVGPPFPGVEVEIDGPDAEGNGDLVVRSPWLTKGYLDQEETNRTVFAQGAFHTGDIGRRGPDGRLYLTGRRRLFIEVEGNKVDPFEVEDVLAQHTAVREALVIANAAGRGLRAIVVLHEPVPADTLRGFCRSRLAAFKVPEVVEVRDQLPRSPIGKLLRGSA